MNLRAPVLLCILTSALSGPCSMALADGLILSRHSNEFWEPGQIALIQYDEDAGIQDMLLQVMFYGDAGDFAWIVPLPAAPEIETADPRVFDDLADFTQPVRRPRQRLNCSGTTTVAIPAAEGDVTIIAEESVGIYETLTLAADDAAALADSLRAWGYLHPLNDDGIEEALDYYIDKSWVFVVMKIDDELDWEPDQYGYWGAYIDPIRFRFPSEQIVFPMRISAASAYVDTDVVLYVCAGHRMHFPGARTSYARRMQARELEHLRVVYPALANVLAEECYLTKLKRRYHPSEMVEDLRLVRAADDGEYVDVVHTRIPVAESGLFLFWGWVASRAWRRRRGRRRD